MLVFISPLSLISFPVTLKQFIYTGFSNALFGTNLELMTEKLAPESIKNKQSVPKIVPLNTDLMLKRMF